MLRVISLMFVMLVSAASSSLGQTVKGEFSFSIIDVHPSTAEMYERYGLENGQILKGEFIYDLYAPSVVLPDANLQTPGVNPLIAADVEVYFSDSFQLSVLDSDETIIREEGLPVSLTLAGSGMSNNGSALADGFVIGSGFAVDAGNLVSFQMIDSEAPGRLVSSRELPSGPAELNLDSRFEIVLEGWDIAQENLGFTLSIVPEPSSNTLSLFGLVAVLVVARRRARSH